MSNPHNPTDGQHVVIQNGQRVTKTMDESAAIAEAKKLNQHLAESQGQRVPEGQKAQVKRNLCG